MVQSFKEFEHKAWQQAVDQYVKSFSGLTRQMIPAILDALKIQEGLNMLDVACGPGYLAAAAHQKGANVNGVDFSSSMVSRAKQLHPGIDFREGDAETLEQYPDAYFDAVGMNFGIIHLGQPENALQAANRVLKLGGKMAFTSWCKPQETIGFLLVFRAVEMFGNLNVELPEAPPHFFYSSAENCKNILMQYGFSNSNVQIVNQIWELDTPDELFDAFLKGSARAAGLLKKQSTEQLASIKETLRHAVKDYMHCGKICIPMPALLTWGTKYKDAK